MNDAASKAASADTLGLRDFIKNPNLGDARPSLVGMDRAELAAALAPLGVKPYRAQQVFRWIYNCLIQ